MSKTKQQTTRYRVIVRGDIESILKAFAYMECVTKVATIIPHHETRKVDEFFVAKEITTDWSKYPIDDFVDMANRITYCLFDEYSKIVRIERV